MHSPCFFIMYDQGPVKPSYLYSTHCFLPACIDFSFKRHTRVCACIKLLKQQASVESNTSFYMLNVVFFVNVSLYAFQLEKQKRLERIRQKRSQLEELILQVCTNMDHRLFCVCVCVSAVALVRKHVALPLNTFECLDHIGMLVL